MMNDKSNDNLKGISQAFAELHITGYYFAPVVNTPERTQEVSQKVLSKATLSTKKTDKADISMISFSDQNVRNCFHVFKRSFVKSDPAFAEMSKMEVKTKVFLKSHPMGDKEQKWYDTMARHGYRSRGVSVFELKCAKPLLGVIVFFSDQPPEVLSELIENSEAFSRIADSLAERIVTTLNSHTNPWVALGAISSNSHKILKLLADGMDTGEIAQEVSLTRRGVDYHIELMKELLQTKSRAHLIAKAFREGVIS